MADEFGTGPRACGVSAMSGASPRSFLDVPLTSAPSSGDLWERVVGDTPAITWSPGLLDGGAR